MRYLKIGIVLILVIAALGLALFAYFLNTLPDPSNIKVQNLSSTKIYDRTGQVVLYQIGGQRGDYVSLGQVNPYLKEATLAAEDAGFYQHGAIDLSAILRSVFLDIKNLPFGGPFYGGSTLTQQLAKTTFLTPQKTISRKIRELILAYELERKYSKDQIFEFYLNSVSYGMSTYGIGAASRMYFGKDPKNLDLAQAAVLAALPNSPSRLSPFGGHQDELFNRQHYILNRMVELGSISEKQARQAGKEKLTFLKPTQTILAPHFVMYVKQILEDQFGRDEVEKGNLNVLTTLDYNLQQIAEKAVANGAKRNTELYQGKNAALLSLDPKTGEILAMVGSADFWDESIDGQYNVVTGLRQPGSAFKVFSYTTLFEKGYSPESVLFDLPTEFTPNDSKCPLLVNFDNNDPDCYHPQNFNKRFLGPVTLRQALAQSINLPSVKVIYLAGVAETLRTAQTFGITTLASPQNYGLSLGLGTATVKMIDMARAYSVFANDGQLPSLSPILQVSDASGKNLYQYQPNLTQVVDPQYPRLINDILSDDQARAGLFGLNSPMNLPGHTSAVKTGTSQDFKDAWAIGYTPALVTAVWAGNSDNTPMKTSGGILAAVPIWHEFMTQALANKPDIPFVKPNPVPETKPMLNGQFIVQRQIQENNSSQEIHSILYYLDKDNPLGAFPQDPSQDPQFLNWELPVVTWAVKNYPGPDIQTEFLNLLKQIKH